MVQRMIRISTVGVALVALGGLVWSAQLRANPPEPSPPDGEAPQAEAAGTPPVDEVLPSTKALVPPIELATPAPPEDAPEQDVFFWATKAAPPPIPLPERAEGALSDEAGAPSLEPGEVPGRSGVFLPATKAAPPANAFLPATKAAPPALGLEERLVPQQQAPQQAIEDTADPQPTREAPE